MLLAAAKGNREKIKNYLVGRYDQNMRYVDDQLARLFGRVGDEATVVVFADHGEEFFDHGDLEHGHTLYDELLRIPFIVKSPGLAPRRVATPVSLLDLTPTVLDLLGAPDPKLAPPTRCAPASPAARFGPDGRGSPHTPPLVAGGGGHPRGPQGGFLVGCKKIFFFFPPPPPQFFFFFLLAQQLFFCAHFLYHSKK